MARCTDAALSQANAASVFDAVQQAMTIWRSPASPHLCIAQSL
jgi:hypothetical protein